MTEQAKDLCVTMVLNELAAAPVYELGTDYSLHWYAPGDEKLWMAIHEAAEKNDEFTLELFFGQFSDDDLDLHDRQCYLLDPTGRAIATGTAWGERGGEFSGYGLVHWIAVCPELQGCGVGTMVMSVVCRRLVSLGHTSALLRTSTTNRRAIGLYEKFGFRTKRIEEWGQPAASPDAAR